MLFGFGRVPGCLGLGALFLWDEWRDERTVCQRGGCMVVPGAVVSPGPDHAAALLAVCPFWFWGVREWWFAGRGWAISAALDGCRG